MKTTLKLSLCYAIAAFALMGCAANRSIASTERQPQYQEAAPPVSVDIFYQSLSPYGNWITYPQYGRVWVPRVRRGFEPYSTNGHWIYTDYGWTWASDYSWGWAPFHYGRWMLDDYYGWIWVPGTEWAPAWVAWRNSSDYFGWAPLGPGIHININIGIPAARWTFVPRNYFGYRNAYRYYMPRQRNTYIIHNTTIINNTNIYNNNRYFSGPRRVEVEQSTRRAIRPVKIEDASRPGAARVSSNQVSLYRPTVQRSNDNEDARPFRNSDRLPANNNRQETERNRSNSQSRPSRVFRGQETERTNTQPAEPQRSSRPEPQRSAPERQSQPTEIQRSNRPAQQRNAPESHSESPAPSRNTERRSAPQHSNTSETNRPDRVFRQPPSNRNTSQSSVSRPSRSRPAVNTSSTSVQRAGSRSSEPSRPARESGNSRSHRR